MLDLFPLCLLAVLHAKVLCEQALALQHDTHMGRPLCGSCESSAGSDQHTHSRAEQRKQFASADLPVLIRQQVNGYVVQWLSYLHVFGREESECPAVRGLVQLRIERMSCLVLGSTPPDPCVQ